MLNNLKLLINKDFKEIFFSFIGFFCLILLPFFVNFLSLYTFKLMDSVYADLSIFFGLFPSVNVIIIPIIMARIWFNQIKYNTEELLLTLPFSEWEIILSRYLSALIFHSIFLTLTLITPVSLLSSGHFNKGLIFTNYLLIFLASFASISIVLFIMILFKGKIIGLIVSFFILILLSGSLFGKPYGSIITFARHSIAMSLGQIILIDLVYFIIVTLLFLNMSHFLMILRRWKK